MATNNIPAHPRVRHSYSGVGPWAGHRVITAGKHVTEYPSGMLTEAEDAKSD